MFGLLSGAMNQQTPTVPEVIDPGPNPADPLAYYRMLSWMYGPQGMAGLSGLSPQHQGFEQWQGLPGPMGGQMPRGLLDMLPDLTPMLSQQGTPSMPTLMPR